MSHRQFTDSSGRTWDVWDVHPTAAARSIAAFSGAEQCGADQRNVVAPALADGWLCFEHDRERRRLAPVPSGWTELPTTALERLRDDATRVPPPDERARGSAVPHAAEPPHQQQQARALG